MYTEDFLSQTNKIKKKINKRNYGDKDNNILLKSGVNF